MKNEIKKYISQNFLYNDDNIQDDEPLFETGRIDSLGLLKLIAHIEDTFGVSFDRSEISIDNFSTINDIERNIKEKMS